MIAPSILQALHEVDKARQEAVAVNFIKLWESKYPHWVSTLGTRRPIPEVVEARLDCYLVRMPIPVLGFSLWGFKTESDLGRFLKQLPPLMSDTKIRYRGHRV